MIGVIDGVGLVENANGQGVVTLRRHELHSDTTIGKRHVRGMDLSLVPECWDRALRPADHRRGKSDGRQDRATGASRSAFGVNHLG
jgi:hypothetical protein